MPCELPGLLVDPAWLADHLRQVVVADVRWYLDGRSGPDAHEQGHIPGAAHLDIDADLSARPSPGGGRHPLPGPKRLAAVLSAAGIGDDDAVVAYDDAGGAMAARLVWMLRVTGHAAALLDGGLQAWAGPVETGRVSRPQAQFTPRRWPAKLLASIDYAAGTAGRANAVLLDARPADRYRGESEPIDPRPGHIPGARNLPFAGNLDPVTNRFLSAAQLRARFEAVGAGNGVEVVAYCGSGVTACHDLLALEIAGLPPGRLFPGSWSAWSADPARPAATGARPGTSRTRRRTPTTGPVHKPRSKPREGGEV